MRVKSHTLPRQAFMAGQGKACWPAGGVAFLIGENEKQIGPLLAAATQPKRWCRYGLCLYATGIAHSHRGGGDGPRACQNGAP